jgi:hypothetical protein
LNEIEIGRGKLNSSQFDKSFYSDDHDVPAIYIGGQIIELGAGFDIYTDEKDENSLLYKLDKEKTYQVIIREVDPENETEKEKLDGYKERIKKILHGD